MTDELLRALVDAGCAHKMALEAEQTARDAVEAAWTEYKAVRDKEQKP